MNLLLSSIFFVTSSTNSFFLTFLRYSESSHLFDLYSLTRTQVLGPWDLPFLKTPRRNIIPFVRPLSSQNKRLLGLNTGKISPRPNQSHPETQDLSGAQLDRIRVGGEVDVCTLRPCSRLRTGTLSRDWRCIVTWIKTEDTPVFRRWLRDCHRNDLTVDNSRQR